MNNADPEPVGAAAACDCARAEVPGAVKHSSRRSTVVQRRIAAVANGMPFVLSGQRTRSGAEDDSYEDSNGQLVLRHGLLLRCEMRSAQGFRDARAADTHKRAYVAFDPGIQDVAGVRSSELPRRPCPAARIESCRRESGGLAAAPIKDATPAPIFSELVQVSAFIQTMEGRRRKPLRRYPSMPKSLR